MEIISEIDVEFNGRIHKKYSHMNIILHYKGYRPGHDEFFDLLRVGYFQDKIVPPEVLIPESYRMLENNPRLDNRVKAFMRDNELTLCETFYPNHYGGFTYIANYSFDNYGTFGIIIMDSSAKRFQV